jgi:ferredoxin
MEAGIRNGGDFVDFSDGARVENLEGSLVSSFPIAQAVHECDGIVNLPKMKTHQLTRITGAVKNLFGCVPGKRKALYHLQFQDPTVFSTLLVELGLQLRPRLHIMDGIVAMEGNGPRGGDPNPLGVLILSEDPVAVDATFCRLVAMDPSFVPTTVIGERKGLGRFAEGEIEYVGERLEVLMDRGFKVIRKPVYGNASYAHYTIIKNAVLPRPVIDEANCIRCGRCVEACPVPDKALHFEDDRRRPPRYDYDLCIRCYCCHEMCPERAIRRKTPLLGRILGFG